MTFFDIYESNTRMQSGCDFACIPLIIVSIWLFDHLHIKFSVSRQEYMDANKCIDELLKQLEEERRNVRR